MTENSNIQVIGKIRGVDEVGIFTSLPVDLILEDPDNPNPRGPVRDTTDLQQSIKEHGILSPLLVRPIPDQDGYFYRIQGERRQIAAKTIGYETVPVIIRGVDPEEVRRLMLAGDIHKKHPDLVLDKEGEVIGGTCLAVYEEIKAGRKRKNLAPAMGVPSDVVGAYHRLYSDIPEIKRKVAAGGMAITVYSLVKRFDPDFKRYLAKKKGKVSATYVRRAKKNWEEIKGRMEEPGTEPEEMPEGTEIVQVAPMKDVEQLSSLHIGKALSAVSHIRNMVEAEKMDLDNADFALLLELYNEVKDLLQRDMETVEPDFEGEPDTAEENEEEPVEEEGGEYVFG